MSEINELMLVIGLYVLSILISLFLFAWASIFPEQVMWLNVNISRIMSFKIIEFITLFLFLFLPALMMILMIFYIISLFKDDQGDDDQETALSVDSEKLIKDIRV